VFSRRLFDIAVALGDGRATAEAASDYVRGEPGRVQEINEALQELSLPASVLDTMAAAATSLSDADSADAARALLAAEWALGTTSQGVAPRYFIRSAAAGRDPVNALFAAANQLEGRGFSDVATYLHESLALTFPQSPFSQRSALVAADRFAAMGKRARATSLYEWIISRGNSPYEDDARIAFGHTLLAGDSISAAQRQFGWAASRGRTVQLRRQGTFGLAQCAVRSGRLDEAQSLLEPLADSTMAFSDAARAYLRLAEINLYHGDAVTMQQHCNAVILRSSGSDEANDCLELSGILAEANGDTLAWQAYGELAYLLATKQLEFVLTKATEFDNGPLTGRARLVEADALLSLGRLEAAAKALSSTASANDSSAVGEEALWRYGELQRTLIGNPQEALRSYERFLQTFPQSVYLGHARHWIRELRTEVGPL
jgi:tetratricopeptide (TPR) repeat protein